MPGWRCPLGRAALKMERCRVPPAQQKRNDTVRESYPFRCGDTRQRLEERAKEDVENKDGNCRGAMNCACNKRQSLDAGLSVQASEKSIKACHVLPRRPGVIAYAAGTSAAMVAISLIFCLSLVFMKAILPSCSGCVKLFFWPLAHIFCFNVWFS